MKPSIGRVVHYHPDIHYDGDAFHPGPWMGHVIAVDDSTGNVDLAVLVRWKTGCIAWRLFENVSFAEDYASGCWSWPPRV